MSGCPYISQLQKKGPDTNFTDHQIASELELDQPRGTLQGKALMNLVLVRRQQEFLKFNRGAD